jgi:hypothetical protein
MTITFFGHREITDTEKIEEKLIVILKSIIKNEPCEFLFGGYGMFDALAYRCCKNFFDYSDKSQSKLVFVTPYITENFLETIGKYSFDDIVYPPIEKVPPKFAINARNKWMVEQADMIITCISRKYGGAYSSYLYAKRKNKTVVNIGSLEN